MTPIDFDKLRPGGAGCPSDLALDRFHAGALLPEGKEQLSAHLEGCATCRSRLEERGAGFAAFPGVDERKLLAAIYRRLDEPAAPASRFARLASFFQGPQRPLAAALLLCALLLLFFVVRPLSAPPGPSATVTEEGGVRIKGGLMLHVFRQRDRGAEELLSGDRVHPGDTLRFAVDLPSPGRLAIVGVDSRGELYTAWPLDKEATREWPAGLRTELPGAVALDDTLGEERFYLVHCPLSLGPPICRVADRKLHCPPGCALAPFLLNKGP
jgi:hypothetical protein